MPCGILLCYFPQESSLNRSLAVSRKAEGEHNGHHGWKTPLTEGRSLLRKAQHYIKIKHNNEIIRKPCVCLHIECGVLDYVGIMLTNMK